MAELTKVLHFLKSGTEQTAKAYSTVDEAGDNYVQGKVDNVACYIPIGATDDAMATNGRVIKSGTTYAIKSSASLPYTEVKYTTPGTFTFTAPAGVTRVRVAVIAGGGYGLDGDTVQQNPTGSQFHTLTASAPTDLATAGSPNGRGGEIYPDTVIPPLGSVTLNGYAGYALDFDVASIGNYGGGGEFFVKNYNSGSGETLTVQGLNKSPSGGKNVGYVNVTAGQTYTVVVGQGYKGDMSIPSNFLMSTTGENGAVLVAYGGDI